MARFAERPQEWKGTVHTEGWVTLWPTSAIPEADSASGTNETGYVMIPSPKLAGFQLDWLCPDCFELARHELRFFVDPEHPQWKQVGL